MLENKLKEYDEKFGESFPMMPLAWGLTEQETVELIDECIRMGKSAYERGLVSDDTDIEY